MELRMEIERKPDVDALLSRMSALTDAQRNYVLGVIDGTAAQIARERAATAAQTQ